MSTLRILYIGPDYRGSNGTSWRDAFVELGHDVRTLDDERFDPAPRDTAGRLVRKLRGRPPLRMVEDLNRAIVETCREFRPDLTFFVKAYHVTPDTLDAVAGISPRFVYMNDDMFNPANQSPTFRDNVPRFDCILTTKSFNVREFHDAGAPLAVYLPNAYDPQVHHPAEPTAEERRRMEGDVAFIGTFRPSRADFLARLAASRDHFRMNVWGGGWGKMARYPHRAWGWRKLRGAVRGCEVIAEQMGKAVAANSASLGLLYHDNRDLHTSRSFEIPACGGFMIAERTEEHLLYFEEDKEAVYFGPFEELISKLRFYLAHEEPRRRIARAAYRRAISSPYRYVDRARTAMELAAALRPRTHVPGPHAGAREEAAR
ncbi:MAG TPA: glycosyltransferase [Bryobacteraceae bacterium]|nr:glycosyltransferase [Bryobacteraceae bacterium]